MTSRLDDSTMAAFEIGCDVDTFVNSRLCGTERSLTPLQKLQLLAQRQVLGAEMVWGIRSNWPFSAHFQMFDDLCLLDEVGIIITPTTGAKLLDRASWVTGSSPKPSEFVVMFDAADMLCGGIDLYAWAAYTRAGRAPHWSPEREMPPLDFSVCGSNVEPAARGYYRSLFFDAPHLTPEQLSWFVDVSCNSRAPASAYWQLPAHRALAQVIIRQHAPSLVDFFLSMSSFQQLEALCHAEFAAASPT